MTMQKDAVASQTPITFIDFLLDETGSMSSCATATKAGFDNFVASQREAEGSCYLTLAKFDSNGIRTPYENLDIGLVPRLSFFPGSTTNLYDCIGQRLQSVLDQNRTGQSLFIILTDGGDNASREYNLQSARDLIIRAQDGGIVVVFMGPSDSAHKVGTHLGIPSGNIRPFSTSEMSSTMDDFTAATRAFRAGATTSETFFS